MDRHLLEAFIESLADAFADKVVQRLDLRPPVKAVERSSGAGLTSVAPPDASAARTPQSAPQDAPQPSPDLLDTRQAAELLGMSVGGLENMRAKGIGPKYIRVGRAIRYRRSDLIA